MGSTRDFLRLQFHPKNYTQKILTPDTFTRTTKVRYRLRERSLIVRMYEYYVSRISQCLTTALGRDSFYLYGMKDEFYR